MKYLLLAFLVIFTGCSNKKYFEPKKYEEKELAQTSTTASKIISMNRDVASLQNGHFINTKGLSKKKLQEGFEIINYSENKIIASNFKDTLLINEEKLETKDPVIAASLKGDLLAMIYSNNAIELYDMKIKRTLFKEYLSLSLANDTRITNPLFMDKILLFPTLDGKINIVSLDSNKSVKNIIVDAKGEFNNIILLELIDNTLIAATQNKIITIHNQNLSTKELEIRELLVKNKTIYIALIDGTISSYDFSLKEISKKKFKYAKYHALAFGKENLYAIESQGFIIKLNKDLSKDTIYKFDFDNEKRMIVLDKNRVYFDENSMILP